MRARRELARTTVPKCLATTILPPVGASSVALSRPNRHQFIVYGHLEQPVIFSKPRHVLILATESGSTS